MIDKTYPLKRMLWVPPLAISLFGMMTLSFYSKAVAGNTSFRVFKAITLSTEISTFVLWLLFAFCLGMSLFGIFLLFALIQGNRKITLTNQSIIAPKFSFKGIKHIEIPYKSITKLEYFKAGNGIFLNLHHAKGKTSLAQAAFNSKSEFDEIYTLLKSHING